MKAWLPLALVLLASGSSRAASDPGAAPLAVEATEGSAPGVLEALRYNVRERTTKAMAELERGNFDAAARSLETAHRLTPESPTALYNLGTGHLHALDSRAIAELETLLEVAPPPLVADTAYNLGNARFAASDFQGAIEAYKSALRADGDYADAKHNLELALEKIEEQQQQQQSGDSDSESDSEGDRGESGDEDSSPSDEESEDEDSSDGDQENESPGNEPESDESDRDDRRDALPQFEEQPEMTAEQAAAILEAVDNLERQQRQEDARERARPVPVGGKDW